MLGCFTKMNFPKIMVAPNGARKTKRDHPRLPISIDEVVEAAIASREAGADGLHAHVRDAKGRHVLDAGLYRELLSECELKLPGLYTQITTEAVGVYSAKEQDAVVRQVEPQAVSVALSEMMSGEERDLARNFYHWASEMAIDVQHILYTSDEMEMISHCLQSGIIPNGKLHLLFVLGRYSENQQSEPGDLLPYTSAINSQFGSQPDVDWAVCAFGRRETDCLVGAVKLGGNVRVGFENNQINHDGSIAADNAERVREVAMAIEALGIHA